MPSPDLTYEFFNKAAAFALDNMRTAFERRVEEVLVRPSFAEQVANAELLGLAVCTCLGVDHDNRRTVIIDPACKVHNYRCATCKRAY